MPPRRDSSFRWHLLPLGALLCACCSGGAPPPGTPAMDGGGAIDAGTPAPADAGQVAVCPPAMTYGGGEQTIVPGSVAAKLVDETGAPVAAGQPLFICGLNVCVAPQFVSAGGGAAIATTTKVKKPAFKFGDGINYAEFAVPLTTSAVDFRTQGTGLLATAKLAGKPGAALTPGGDATSGDVTVSLAADASVGFDTLVYDTPDTQLFRAVRIPLDNAGPLLPAAPGDFALLYGVSPAETTLCPPARVTVRLPDGLGWTPGAPVEFWIMTTDTTQTYAPYAGWALMSEGAVSADGKTIVTADGQGFRLLENFAVRLKR